MRPRPREALLTARLSIRVTPELHSYVHTTAKQLGATASEFGEFLLRTPTNLSDDTETIAAAFAEYRETQESTTG